LGLFLKLPRPVVVASSVHNQLRVLGRVERDRPRADASQHVTLTEAKLRIAEAQYHTGATFREVAAPLGIRHMRLGSLVRKRGVRMLGGFRTNAEVDSMASLDGQGDSVARIGKRLGFQPSTIRNQLLKRGISTRDTHGKNK